MDTGIILSFLKELNENNNRDWFKGNKQKYDKALAELEKFIVLLIPKIAAFDPEIINLGTKDCLFRIYRDTRFSNDKTPYKTNFGAHFVGGGKKSGRAGYYLHLEPGSCFFGGGIYMPRPEILKPVRKEIFLNYQAFSKIVKDKKFCTLFGEISGEKLKVAPSGFPRDFEGMDFLKYKSYTVLQMITDKQAKSPAYEKMAIESFKAMKSFNKFINEAIM